MEKDAPKGEPFGIPTNLECLLLWFSTSRDCFSEAVKKPPVFCGPLIVQSISCPISRGLLPSDIVGTADSVRRWEQSEPDGGGQAHAKERTTERGSCPLWVYKGPCPLLALSPISVHTEMGPPEAPFRYAAEMGPSGASLPLCSGKKKTVRAAALTAPVRFRESHIYRYKAPPGPWALWRGASGWRCPSRSPARTLPRR